MSNMIIILARWKSYSDVWLGSIWHLLAKQLRVSQYNIDNLVKQYDSCIYWQLKVVDFL